jgi:hypothetical protein
MVGCLKRKNIRREWLLNFLAFEVSWQCIHVLCLHVCCNMSEENVFERLQNIMKEEEA